MFAASSSSSQSQQLRRSPYLSSSTSASAAFRNQVRFFPSNCDGLEIRNWVRNSLLFKKRRGCLASSLLDSKLHAKKIWSRPWKKNMVDLTLYLLKFQNLKNIRSTWYVLYQGSDWLGVCVTERRTYIIKLKFLIF